ncbi:unnamed protein product [Pleuronectes platessa]|uniref:Uncharacterized protein n=1 Tax=Pleuronectes platessa TaxID=8262 RepID=A0A9N7VFS5_PLEPL|nr:unnamed protein product [Pleuronectes platessa]
MSNVGNSAAFAGGRTFLTYPSSPRCRPSTPPLSSPRLHLFHYSRSAAHSPTPSLISHCWDYLPSAVRRCVVSSLSALRKQRSANAVTNNQHGYQSAESFVCVNTWRSC